MEFRTFTNGLGEKATTDGLRVWRGEDTDETTIRMEALQPVDTVFPPCAESDAEAKLNQIAVDCILDRAPSIQPDDDEEREAFRRLWNSVTEMKNEFVLCVEPLAFSNELGVYARDVVYGIKPGMKMAYVLFFTDHELVAQDNSFARPFALYPPVSLKIHELSAIRAAMRVSVLMSGKYCKVPFGHSAEVCPDGRTMLLGDACATATLMIALRTRTDWHKAWRETLPF